MCVSVCLLVLCNPKATWPTNETSYSNHVRECSQVDNINCTENIKKQHRDERVAHSQRPFDQPTDTHTLSDAQSTSRLAIFISSAQSNANSNSTIRTFERGVRAGGGWRRHTQTNSKTFFFLILFRFCLRFFSLVHLLHLSAVGMFCI